MKFFKRVFMKRMDEATLNKESALGANHFIKEKMKGAPMEALQNANNYVATGFYMGYRKCEEDYGARREKQR